MPLIGNLGHLPTSGLTPKITIPRCMCTILSNSDPLDATANTHYFISSGQIKFTGNLLIRFLALISPEIEFMDS